MTAPLLSWRQQAAGRTWIQAEGDPQQGGSVSDFDSTLSELRWVCPRHLDFLPETNTAASDSMSVNPGAHTAASTPPATP